jgi:uncharacterized damage-inducible protein DinB
MIPDDTIRKYLLASLQGRKAHLSFEETVKDFPDDYYNRKIPGIQYSCWDLLEHLRLAQWDILDFIVNPDYKSKQWPDGYWTKDKGDTEKWESSVNKCLKDLRDLEAMVNDHTIDLYSPIPHAPDYTIFQEIILVINHNSYHTGQLLMMRKGLGIWSANHNVNDYL